MKKIMFNTRYGLEQAVINRLKWKTRRLVPDDTPIGNWSETVRKSKYQVGEVVAVAQSYRTIAEGGYPVDSRYDAFRTANWGDEEDGELKSSAGWTNKMFVRADLMPHQIRITDVRMERLQEISNDDCIAEGIRKSVIEYADKKIIQYTYFESKRTTWYDTPREAYAALIDKISGRGTWDCNPWVFVYDFELVK